MADAKISALPASTTPLVGTEVLPVVQSSTTKQVSVANLTAGRSVSAASLTLTTTPLAATSGGTGSSSAFTADGVVYASSTSTLATSSAVRYNGTAFIVSGKYITVSGGGQGYRVDGVIEIDRDQDYGWLKVGSTDVQIRFYTNSTLVGQFGTSDFTLNTGNLIQGTAAKGFNFTANTPAAGMTSQLLNWYEEGTFTPTITVSAGSLSGSSTSGAYTRIGRQVTVQIYVEVGTSTAASGATIGGLPFTTASGTLRPVGVFRENANSGNMWQLILSAGGTSGTFRRYDNNSALTTGDKFFGTVTYNV